MNFQEIQKLPMSIALSCVFLSGCGNESGGGIISIGSIDSEALVQELTAAQIAAGPIEQPVATPNTPVIPTTNPINITTTDPNPEVATPTSGDELVFARSGLERMIGYNKLSWATDNFAFPSVDEYYFFTDSDIGVDDNSNPQLVQQLDDGGLVVALYLEQPGTTTGVHSLARIYSDSSVVLHTFNTNGASVAIGIFVQCLPGVAINACLNELAVNPDGISFYTHSTTPIAYAPSAPGAISNPDEIIAWIHYGNDTSSAAARRAESAELELTETQRALARAIEALR